MRGWSIYCDDLYLRKPVERIPQRSISGDSHTETKYARVFLEESLFGMAEVLLELPKPEFPFIGAVTQDEPGEWTLQKRPLTFNMNRLAQNNATIIHN